MDKYENATYGDRIASHYDEFIPISPEQTQAAVETLAVLANGGRVLELGIGTGRIALRLAVKGVAVHGIDASSRMLEELRQKPGGDAIPVTLGDFGEVAVDGAGSAWFLSYLTRFSSCSRKKRRCVVSPTLPPTSNPEVSSRLRHLSRIRRATFEIRMLLSRR